MILVSACLAGLATRYDGRRLEMTLPFDAAVTPVIPVCPEQLGGLPTPRPPACIVAGAGDDVLDGKARVITAGGADVTKNYLRGAEEVCKIARLFRITQAFMAEKSPSCGVTVIKDLNGTERPGCGVAVAALKRVGVACVGINPKKT